MKFEKGKSGNPGGRPKVISKVKKLAREQTDLALEVLVEIAKDKKSTHAARVSAATALLDRGWGKPSQALEHSGPDGEDLPSPITMIITEELVKSIVEQIKDEF